MPSLPPPLPHPRAPELPEGIEPKPDDNPAKGTPPRERLPAWPAWSPFAAMLLVVVVVFGAVSVLTVLLLVVGIDPDETADSSAIDIAGILIQDVALIAAPVLVATRVAGRPTPWQFGLRRTALWPAVGWALAVLVGFYMLSAIYAVAVDVQQEDELLQDLGARDSALALAAITVLVTILAPIGEELFFRGFLFTAMRRWIDTVPAALVTGVLFAAVHVPSKPIELAVPLVILGAGLCLLYHVTGSLLPCMAVHSLNNSIAVGVSEGWTWYATVGMMAAAIAVILLLVLPLTRSRRLNLAPATA